MEPPRSIEFGTGQTIAAYVPGHDTVKAGVGRSGSQLPAPRCARPQVLHSPGSAHPDARAGASRAAAAVGAALRVLAPAAAALYRKHRAHVVTPRADLWLLDDAFTGNTVVIARPNGSPPPSP